MDIAEEEYILKYYMHLLDIDDKLLYKKIKVEERRGVMSDSMMDVFKKRFLKVTDEELATVDISQFSNFDKDVAEYILKKYPQEIYFNNCPKCKGLARTPSAKQCRFCGHDWHNQ
jgi:hypothetical protein